MKRGEACPTLATPAGASRLGCVVHPGYAGVGVAGELDHIRGRQPGFLRLPYVYLDATDLDGREQARKQVISRAVIVAVGNRCAQA